MYWRHLVFFSAYISQLLLPPCTAACLPVNSRPRRAFYATTKASIFGRRNIFSWEKIGDKVFGLYSLRLAPVNNSAGWCHITKGCPKLNIHCVYNRFTQTQILPSLKIVIFTSMSFGEIKIWTPLYRQGLHNTSGHSHLWMLNS